MGIVDWFKRSHSAPGADATQAEPEDDASGPGAALRQLEDSGLFDAGFPKRWAVTHAQRARATEAEVAAYYYEPGIEAIHMVPHHRELVDLVQLLGSERYDPAVPLLTRLWADCALHPVWVAAGHALRDIGTSEARRALQGAIEDSDHFSVFLAVRAIFDEDPKAAYERLAPRFAPERLAEPGGPMIASVVLRSFAPDLRMGEDRKLAPEWQDDSARHSFLADPRWMQLCARLRRDPVLGSLARAALRYADADLVKSAIERARALEPVVSRPVRSAASGDLLTRYRRGDHEAVWAELKAPLAIDGAFREEAFAVAQETMRRFLAASELLITRLGKAGWRPLAGAFRAPPAEEDAALMAETERLTGAPLPPALRAFWEIVGGVDFVWDYQGDDEPPDLGLELDLEELDALSIDPARGLGGAIERWNDENSNLLDPDLAGPFIVDLAPDRITKAGVSGGGPYGIELPFAGVDPTFGNEEWSAPLVDYLRTAVRWGGFPGLATHDDPMAVQRFLADLTLGLEPF